MIAYVFLVWVSAVLFFWVTEAIVFFCLPHPQAYLSEIFEVYPALYQQLGQHLNQIPWFADLALISALSVCSVIGGYIVEWKLQPVFNSYRRLQKSYPNWYRRWPAVWREICLLLLVSCIGSLLFWPIFFLSQHVLMYLYIAWFSFCIGLSILPIRRLYTLQREDRPEKPPQALIHTIAPNFPLKYSLIIGQFYLRLIVPLFCLFVLLIPSLGLAYLHLQGIDYFLLLGGVSTGLGLAWLLSREEFHLNTDYFQRDLLQVSGRLLLAGGLLHFAAYSENLIILGIFTVFAGWLTGSYS